MRYISLFFIFIMAQFFFLINTLKSEEPAYLMILLTLVSLGFYLLFTVCIVWITSIMKVVEFAIGVSCKKYLTEDRVPDLGMTPVPNEEIDDKSDVLIDNVVLIIRKEEGLVQNLLKKAARMKASTLIEDLKEFQERNKYEQVAEKELVHFMVEWKSKSIAEIFCRMPIIFSYITAIGLIGTFIVSAFFFWLLE